LKIKMSDGDDKKRVKISFKVLSENDYNKLKSSKQLAIERERNLQVLFKLRPQLFDLDDQERHDQIAYKVKLTAVLAVGGFISTSGFRVWQIKTHNKDVTLGVAAIVASYLPAYCYYSYYRH